MKILIKTPDDEETQDQQKYWDFDADVTFDESNSALSWHFHYDKDQGNDEGDECMEYLIDILDHDSSWLLYYYYILYYIWFVFCILLFLNLVLRIFYCSSKSSTQGGSRWDGPEI